MTRTNAAKREERQAEIYLLRSQGLTMRAIAEAVGVSHATVSRMLASAGDPCPHVYPEPKHCSLDGCERLSNYGPLGYCRMHEVRLAHGRSLDVSLLRAPNGQRTRCIVDKCDQPRASKTGYCRGHALRAKKGGSLDTPLEPRMKQPETCLFDGCKNRPLANGYCGTHLRQKRIHGHMVPVRTIFDPCTYSGAHQRCKQAWGRVSQYGCVRCGEAAAEWAYDGTDPSELYDKERDWALRTILPYSRFPEFYMPMCKSCHKRRDMEELRVELEEFRAWRRSKRSNSHIEDDPPPF